MLLAEILKIEKQMLPLVGKCHWNKSRKSDLQVIAWRQCGSRVALSCSVLTPFICTRVLKSCYLLVRQTFPSPICLALVELKADQKQVPEEVQHLQGADRLCHLPATRHPAQGLGWKNFHWDGKWTSTALSEFLGHICKMKNIPVCFLFVAGQKRVISLDLQIIGTCITILLL